MRLNPYLSFNGTCREAMAFYAKVLDAPSEGLMTYGETPMAGDMPAEMLGRVAHARIRIGDALLMASDSPASLYQTPQGVTVTLNIDEPAEADRVFAALSEGGTITMPIAETFWAHRFGTCIDRFGTPWMVNCEKPMAAAQAAE